MVKHEIFHLRNNIIVIYVIGPKVAFTVVKVGLSRSGSV